MEWLKGKKTYILVALGVLSLLVQYLTGDISLSDFLSSDVVTQLIALLSIGTLRAGVSKVPKVE